MIQSLSNIVVMLSRKSAYPMLERGVTMRT